jgi:membrane dipeptidase
LPQTLAVLGLMVGSVEPGRLTATGLHRSMVIILGAPQDETLETHHPRSTPRVLRRDGENPMNRRDFLISTAGLAIALGSAGDASEAEGTPVLLDETVRWAREAALRMLDPSAKDLEHGLDLHAHSLVFDVYGFAPRAALDPEALRKAEDAGASAMELNDLQEEMGMTRCVSDPAQLALFKAAWQAAGVTCIFQNAGEEGQDPLRLLKRLARYTYVTDVLRPFVAKAITPEDIVAARNEDRHCLYFTGNGVPLAQRWESTAEELGYVRLFYQLGIRMMHLTYNRRNMLGDGCAETANAGLSDLGRAAIAEMNRVGVLVDVAHSGWRTSLEAAKQSRLPVVASHSGCDAVHHHIRCKPDDVIRAIVDTGGLIGICCIPSFLGGGITALLDHIDYVVRTFGIDHVAIGTDVAYTAPPAPIQDKPTPRSRRSRDRFESLWPEGSLGSMPEPQRTLAWTNWPLFTVGLVQRGYRDEDIEKVLGKNMLRVTRDILKGKAG